MAKYVMTGIIILVLFGLFTATVSAALQSDNAHWANDPDWEQWLGGQLNEEKGLYQECSSIPNRIVVKDVPANSTVYLTIIVDFTLANGAHGFDYFTTYNITENPGLTWNLTTPLQESDVTYQALEILDDPLITADNYDGPQYFSIAGNWSNAEYVYPSGTTNPYIISSSINSINPVVIPDIMYPTITTFKAVTLNITMNPTQGGDLIVGWGDHVALGMVSGGLLD